MDAVLLLTGAAVGFFVAAPVGPVAVLCVRRTLADGRVVGYGAGLGAALGDTVFGALAIFSVAAVASFLHEHRPAIQVLGSLALIGLGVRTTRSARSPAAVPARPDGETLLSAFGSAFAVTIVNPVTVVAFLSIFAAFGVSERIDGLLDSWLAIAGVFAGAGAWWFLVVGVASVFRQRFAGAGLARMNALAGLAILGFGVYGLLDLAWRLKT